MNNDINYLIKKYSKPYVPGEKHSSQTNKKIKRNQRIIEKHYLCNLLIEECDFLNLSPSQKEFVHYLIDAFANDFKKLHGRAKKETIILAFIFYVKKLEDSRLKIENYSVCNKYDLTSDVFILIICRVCNYYIQSSPLKIVESNKYDHEILSKNGGKI